MMRNSPSIALREKLKRTVPAGALALTVALAAGACSGQVDENSAQVDAANSSPSAGPFSFCDNPSVDRCLWGVNQAQVYTAPGTLGQAALTLATSTLSSNGWANWPEKWTGSSSDSTQLANCIDSDGSSPGQPPTPPYPGAMCVWFDGDDGSASYILPAPFSPDDVVKVSWDNGDNDQRGMGCTNSQYVNCTATLTGYGEADDPTDNSTVPDSVVQLNNMPMTVVVYNNLQSGSLVLGDAIVDGAILDPTGTTGQVDQYGNIYQTLAPSSVGYLGTYLPTSSTPGQVSISLPYSVSGVNLPINITLQNSLASVSCSASSNPQGISCSDVAVLGQPGGPQTVIVSVHT